MAKNTDSILSRAEVLRISKDVGKTPAQVVLRWGLQRNTAVIPKTGQISRLKENISLFDNSYNQMNQSLNCFTANLSDFARTKSQNYEGSKKLSGKLIAIKDNINIKDYPTTCVSKILTTSCSDMFGTRMFCITAPALLFSIL